MRLMTTSHLKKDCLGSKRSAALLDKARAGALPEPRLRVCPDDLHYKTYISVNESRSIGKGPCPRADKSKLTGLQYSCLSAQMYGSIFPLSKRYSQIVIRWQRRERLQGGSSPLFHQSPLLHRYRYWSLKRPPHRCRVRTFFRTAHSRVEGL
jgi:hypothetical protein